jgi:hypothetical protein
MVAAAGSDPQQQLPLKDISSRHALAGHSIVDG